MTTTITPPAPDVLDVDAGVIEDARARQVRHRRRAVIVFLVIALLGGVAAVAALVISGRGTPETTGEATAGGLPTGAVATLVAAGPLAVGPNGALYVADVARDRILVRQSDGRFRVVAGTGKVGFSGDGGPALDAELSDVTDLAFSPSGALYVADGVRVREIGRDGVIRTIAGDGRQSQTVPNGIPALSAGLGSLHSGHSIAFSPSGQLYTSTGGQILRLTDSGKLEGVRAVNTSGSAKGPLINVERIAVDARGNIDVSGPQGWAIWQIAPGGVAHLVGFAKEVGGFFPVLERGPGGSVYAATGGILARVQTNRLVRVLAFTKPVHGQQFSPSYFSFDPNGTTYIDDNIPHGADAETQQQLVSVHDSRVSLLWQEKNATPK